ncbi:MAG: hypothetical protein A3I07_00285 [Candidatus Doudnabacteria bacterium RIFCSPLOWO2_02_FULL_42_9]|uniref:HD domain-containing protein n=1 Tax=Candidatus Doudnabacteria bacterium RIFCSPHIGHO2_01_FULL_41_86 TaxID=1817821 RepID=A0A1F5N953_9BACT|nr:MAG: hypothetical protein A2717_00990 [Candidatus Doudnabacteria bacterium RIFCSPHIGHO2_01_FULL_41_86]OGE75233.1 MAG: hypothetical protein A3K07_00180 [Candidatus Doudnabacteria bacterium RIFCSPHIGHO2_01_43_10]OGE85152.1 MAG: hypothetical protein A3E28_00565 [Candidatus Doudnabacteria bacterium RIFCSPHIGHO2_12_FULL_42_22]OGE86691.1 MAG: hypothetical protein A3C49_01400 [Candidatus Doudnabacteria bacterium RIFCSPHIGHO2_02_FULL_42_25]OGE92288.1 MAG: hypothetical protein A2895_01555 [Candidatus
MNQLPFTKLYKQGLKVAKLLTESSHLAFFVGGVVRDMLLKRESNNIDIATDATPDQIEKILKKARLPVVPIGKKYGTILTTIDSMPVEITTFRSESRYSDNRHPDQVQFIQDYLADAKRRDFTINALYYDPILKKQFDPTDGIKDLRLRLIRFVGDPKKRIDEDALRMLRAVRLAIQLGFKLEKNAFAAIKTRAKYIQDISGERIKAELDKILLSQNAEKGIRLLDEVGLLKFIFPEVSKLKNFSHKSKKYHLEGDQFDHTILAVKGVEQDDLDLKYAALFHDIGKPAVAKRMFKNGEWVIRTFGHEFESAKLFKGIAKRLRFSRLSAQKIEWTIENHRLESPFSKDMSERKKIILAFHPDFSFLIELWKVDSLANYKRLENGKVGPDYPVGWKKGKNYLKLIEQKKNLLAKLADGNLIMKYSKLKPGPQLGRKIEDIKVQIVLVKIKNENELKRYLST